MYVDQKNGWRSVFTYLGMVTGERIINKRGDIPKKSISGQRHEDNELEKSGEVVWVMTSLSSLLC